MTFEIFYCLFTWPGVVVMRIELEGDEMSPDLVIHQLSPRAQPHNRSTKI
jgi:hypothetical protein